MEIKVYSKTNCPGCNQVKGFLKAAHANFTEVVAEVDLSTEDMKAEVEELTGEPLRSVPFVVVDGKAIGGVPQFMQWFGGVRDTLKEKTAKEDLDVGDFDL